jgi:hypothetical protein
MYFANGVYNRDGTESRQIAEIVERERHLTFVIYRILRRKRNLEDEPLAPPTLRKPKQARVDSLKTGMTCLSHAI